MVSTGPSACSLSQAQKPRPKYLFAFLRVFLFFYFLKLFFTEIYFRFHNLQIYTPTARLRGGRQEGGRDLNVNKIYF